MLFRSMIVTAGKVASSMEFTRSAVTSFSRFISMCASVQNVGKASNKDCFFRFKVPDVCLESYSVCLSQRCFISQIECGEELIGFDELHRIRRDSDPDASSELEYLLLCGGVFDLFPSNLCKHHVCSQHLQSIMEEIGRAHV